MTRWIAVPVLGLLCAAAAARADDVTLSAAKDNTIYSEGTTRSNGAGDGFFTGIAGPNNPGARRRALIAFDVAATVPAGSTITSVELTLRVDQTQAGPVAVGVHRLLADWGEATSNASGNEGMGAPAVMGDATWRFRFFSDVTRRWTAEGGEGDYVTTASAIETVGDIGSFATWGSTVAMVADVQGWLDAPATNFGWLLRDSEDTTRTAKKFHSRQALTASNRPQLHVVFDAPAPPTATATVQPSATATPPATATQVATATVPASATATSGVPQTATATVPASATVTAQPSPSATATGSAVPTETGISSTATATVPPPTGTRTAVSTATVVASATSTETGATATVTETAATPTATAFQPPACVGDCDGNGTVLINELIIGVNIALERTALAACPAFDSSGDGRVTINELIAAVGNALGGC